jgi:hypothetical protein
LGIFATQEWRDPQSIRAELELRGGEVASVDDYPQAATAEQQHHLAVMAAPLLNVWSTVEADGFPLFRLGSQQLFLQSNLLLVLRAVPSVFERK